ncbi:MAG TPA: YihY/virulence factor BrkB family protein [Thermoanaerobaculia bacterium]|nr:YihY/virulence factor BrkB family protein [Thermoanaerobaculia bacterium]
MAFVRRTGFRRFGRVLARVAEDFFGHGVATQGAALAFFTLFSLAPILLVVITVAGVVWGEEAVRARVVSEFAALMGTGAAATVQRVLHGVARERAGRVASVLGAATLLSGASGVFVQLQGALNAVWGVTPRSGHVLRTLLRKRIVSFALLLAVGFLLVVSLAFSAALSALRDYVQWHTAVPVEYLRVADVLVSFLLIAILLALIYRVLPDAEVRFRDVALGALVTAALIDVGKWGIGQYLGRTGIASAFGAAGSVVLILLWIYYASLILLIGAEFTHVHTQEFRDARRPPSAGARRTRRPAAHVRRISGKSAGS